MGESRKIRWIALFLWALLTLFVLRVCGQALVAFFDVGFLPPMAEWYSGIMSYRYLLPAQILIAAILTWICVDFTRGSGFFVRSNVVFATIVPLLGFVYLAAMIARYVVRMVLHPEARWFGGAIPIAFHIILAFFVLAFGLYHWSERRLIHRAATLLPSRRLGG